MTADDGAPYVLDAALVRRSFDVAAKSFDDAAVLHAEVRENLLQRLKLTTLSPRVVLDAGAGTGHSSRALRIRYPQALVLAVDFSSAMLRAASRRQRWLRRFSSVCADANRLPLPDGSVELIFSSLMLQWCDPDVIFAEFRRVLAPHGLLCFATLGPDTLIELRTAWRHVDSYNHVNQFIDMHDLGDALVRNGFASPVLDVERYKLSYTDVRGLTDDLKGTGAHNMTAGRARGLTGRARYAAMRSAYEPFRRDGRLPATCEVVFAHAWTPDAAIKRRGDDDTVVSLAELKQQLRTRREA